MTSNRPQLLILSADRATRTSLAESLRANGWECREVANVADLPRELDATNFIVLVDAEYLGTSEFTTRVVGALSRVIALSRDVNPPANTEVLQNALAVVNPATAPLWHIELLLSRAAQEVSSERSLDKSYRKLFAASTQLQDAGTLAQLIETCCREAVRGAGFERAVIVIGDERHRIQLVKSYSTDERIVENYEGYYGQPLMPVMPGYVVSRRGRGFDVAAEQLSSQARHLIVPLERRDGTVLGFLTLDRPQANNADLAGLSEPVSLLLSATALVIELQQLRATRGRGYLAEERAGTDRTSELRSAHERFTRLVGLTDDIVYVTDAQGRIAYLNEAFTTALGFARENYVGLPLSEVLSELSAETSANAAVLEQLRAPQGERVKQELELFTKTGYRRVFSLSHQWIRQAHDIVGAQGILRDVSERREVLAELMRAERLASAGRYASGVAHEINNPLQAIASHLSGLSSAVSGDKKAQASLNVVADSVDRIRLLMRSMLDLQRPDQLKLVETNIHEIVEKALALQAPQLRQAGIEVERDYDDQIPSLPLRPAEIEQVLLNIVANAIHVMPNGGKLTFATRKSEGLLVMDIRDTGKGIAPEILPRLFEPFATFREQGGGLGLGLYLSRQIMLQHGGDLQASSPPGGGAQFTLTLPMAQ